jgi:hypothetical protein
LAQRFWGVYCALKNRTTMPENEFEELTEHVRIEIKHKMLRYGSTELTNDVHLFENLVQESFAEICKSIK